jgi:branched-chain amino acid transport system substrate-binding protein
MASFPTWDVANDQGIVMNRRAFLIALSGAFLVAWVQIGLAAEPIRVGVTVSLTGAYANLGQDQLEGMQMWADDLNARGALLGREVKLIHYDDASSPEKSAQLYEQLITKDKADLLLGPYSSNITLAASTVAEKHNFPMVATGASSSRIWARGYQNIFQIDTPSVDYMDLPLALANDKGLRRVALVYGGTEFPREVAEGVRARAAEYGMQIVLDEEYPPDTTEFGDLAARMKRANPEIVIGGTYLEDSIGLVRAAKDAGLTPKMLVFTVGPALQEFGNRLGSNANGIMGAVAWMRSGKLPMAYDFSFRYKEKYGGNASVYAAYGYGGGEVLEAAVRLAGSLDKDAIRTQLREMVFISLFGRYRVDEAGRQLGKLAYLMQWQDGHRLLVLPENIADAPPVFPFTWSQR